MILRTRRPDQPTIDALPEWTNVHEVVTRLTAERDAAKRCCDELGDEAERLSAERDELLQERYDLVEQMLPSIAAPKIWPPTEHPVDALLFEELAERLDFMPDLRTDGDDVDWAEEIDKFRTEYAGWD